MTAPTLRTVLFALATLALAASLAGASGVRTETAAYAGSVVAGAPLTCGTPQVACFDLALEEQLVVVDLEDASGLPVVHAFAWRSQDGAWHQDANTFCDGFLHSLPSDAVEVAVAAAARVGLFGCEGVPGVSAPTSGTVTVRVS